MQYVGPPTHAEMPEHRIGAPRLSEITLRSLMNSCTLSNSMRPANANIFRPQYMRPLLPVSYWGAYGSTPSGHTLASTSPVPLEPVQRVSDAIRLAAEARVQARMQPHQVQQRVVPPVEVPETPMSRTFVRASGTATTTQYFDVDPHIYEGNERACSLCQEEFEHGQQVCRLTCRHTFHASWWESFTTHSVSQSQISCPIAGPQVE